MKFSDFTRSCEEYAFLWSVLLRRFYRAFFFEGVFIERSFKAFVSSVLTKCFQWIFLIGAFVQSVLIDRSYRAFLSIVLIARSYRAFLSRVRVERSYRSFLSIVLIARSYVAFLSRAFLSSVFPERSSRAFL